MSIKEFNSGMKTTPSKSSALYSLYLLTGLKASALQRNSDETTLAWTVWSPN